MNRLIQIINERLDEIAKLLDESANPEERRNLESRMHEALFIRSLIAEFLCVEDE
jgi:hypothetical protein